MKHKVESQYKNPDRYIAILKKQVDEAWRRARDDGAALDRERGECVVSWASDIIHKQTAASSILGVLRVHDSIHIVGSVTKVNETLEDDGTSTSKISYRLNETRKVSQ